MSNKILLNRVYSLAGYDIKKANKQYNSLDHSYEILLNRGSNVRLLTDREIETVHLFSDEFEELESLSNKPKNMYFNVRGIISKVYDPIEGCVEKTGKDWKYRTIVIKNKKNFEFDVKLWNNHVPLISNENVNETICIYRCKISEYKGRYEINATASKIKVGNMFLDG